jgi:CheY-like chemotaxis protein
VTASVLTEDRAACADAGLDAYLTKPIRTEELIAVLEQVRPRAAVASPGVDARAADRAGRLVPTGGSTA